MTYVPGISYDHTGISNPDTDNDTVANVASTSISVCSARVLVHVSTTRSEGSARTVVESTARSKYSTRILRENFYANTTRPNGTARIVTIAPIPLTRSTATFANLAAYASTTTKR